MSDLIPITVRINGRPMPAVYIAPPVSGQTRSGYGKRIPSNIMVHYQGRWRRVYVSIYSNSGTAYIGRSLRDGEVVS